MEDFMPELRYPLSFREEDAAKLGELLQQNKSVELIGMKRVGISNFLQFFVFHKGIQAKYLAEHTHPLCVLVDLNDLVERELFAFWRLLLKRIVDAAEDEPHLDKEVVKRMHTIFLECIQTGDSFMTYDGVKECITLLAQQKRYIVLFFNRFHRLHDSMSLEFFHNLLSLQNASQKRLSFVFTNYRPLSYMLGDMFVKNNITFPTILTVKPAKTKDMHVVLKSLETQYRLELEPHIREAILTQSGGHIYYLTIACILLKELEGKSGITADQIIELLRQDERVKSLSEELWESLSSKEQQVFMKMLKKESITASDKQAAAYLWDMGFIVGTTTVFSPLFSHFVLSQRTVAEENDMTFTKKEALLFEALRKRVFEVCTREEIIDEVWPEYKAYGISDWSIDRLISRVRVKLKKQNNPYEILTIRTRGYRLVTV